MANEDDRFTISSFAIFYRTFTEIPLNWVERLTRDFRKLTSMHTCYNNEEYVQTFIDSMAMEHKTFYR